MKSAPEFRKMAQEATAIYEVIGQSGACYVFFWFSDSSICAARKLPSGNKAAATLEFGPITPCLDDCGTSDFEGSTYQKGAELLRRLRS